MCPVSKWVDDHIFFRLYLAFQEDYNNKCCCWQQDIANRGLQQSGGRLWFGGRLFEDGMLEQFDEDCAFPCLDLSSSSTRSCKDMGFTYGMWDIGRLSNLLGIPWETSKDIPFSTTPTFIGFIWDLDNPTISLIMNKITKYLNAIKVWSGSSQHVLQEVQSFYGKLLHACLIYPTG